MRKERGLEEENKAGWRSAKKTGAKHGKI